MKALLLKIAAIGALMVMVLGVKAQTHAEFTTNITSGCSPLVIIFTDQSTGGPTSWRWDFGNGNGSIQRNPSAIYMVPGTYTVRLIASGPGGSDTIVKTQLITVFQDPEARFTVNRTTGCIPAAIAFTDRSTPGSAAITSWLWDFGDGTTSTQQNPVHTYTNPGTYNVTLLTRDANGCRNEYTRNSYITITPRATAGFTGTPTTACRAPHTVNFANTTTGGSGFTYQWTFGDGGTSTQATPSHTYTNTGSYTVRLIATNAAGCSDTVTRTNYVNISGITANFSTNRTNACVGQGINFTSNSPGAVAWHWNFGDGNTSTDQNPSRSYSTAGTYTVTLIVRHANGCRDTLVRTDLITVRPRPTANFTATPLAGCEVPFTVQFTNTTVDGVSWAWDFGDGTTSSQQHPSKTYTSPGTYTVRLVATGANGCTHTRTRTDYITVQIPNVAFTADVRQGCIPLTVRFTDHSSANNAIVGWHWNFGDGSTSTQRHPVHTYTTSGRFDVTLTITTASGCSRSVTYPQYIRAGEQPDIEFTATPRQTCLFFPVFFTDQSTPADSVDFWFWQFGDGGTSFAQHPAYQYGDTGLFTVTLIVGVNGCFDTLVKPDYIRIFPPRASFNTLYSCADPYTVSFTNISLGGHVWLWKFGTGDTAVTRNANYTFPGRGDYNVTLIVWDTIGGCLDSSQALIQVRDPLAAFTANDTVGCVNHSVTFTHSATNAFFFDWNFGDGHTSNNPNPTHTYTTPGVYTVRLIVRDIHNCPDTFIRTNYITALGAFANFNADTLTGCTPLAVNYQDLSTSFMGSVTAWNWDLGAGQTSTQQHPSGNYTVPGNYTITLTITDNNGCSSTLSRVNFITPTYPTPAFYSDDTLVCLGGAVNFVNTSVGNGMTFNWNFGDGHTSTAANPTHTFADTGRYTITLNVRDVNGCDSTTVRNQYIRVVQPSGTFVADTLDANCPPLLVNFSNLSGPDVTNWLYDFGNGQTSNLPNPSHIYVTPGVYHPRLTVTNSIGCVATYDLPDSIVVRGPTGSFTYQQITFCAPFEVDFYAQGTNPAVTHIWDFGDGNVSVDDDTATHYYAIPGTFNPQLILDDMIGCVISLPTISPIYASIVEAGFTSDITFMCRPGMANFTDQSSGVPGIVAWHWNFGDGQTSNLQHPSHYYAAPGRYDVALIATNADGCSDTLFRPGYIRVMDDPTALFSVDVQNACFPATVNFTNQSTADTTIASILWVFGDGGTSTQANPSRSYANPGTYTVQLIVTTVVGCKDTFEMPITLYAPPVAAAGTDVAICMGSSDVLSGSGGIIYQWSPATGLSATNVANPVASPTATTDYVLLVTDVNGCQDRDTVRVTVNPLPTPTATGGTICIGGSAALNAVGGIAYSWDNVGTLSSGTIHNPTASPLATTVYTVTVTDINGCVGTAQAMVNVNPLPTVTTSPDVAICIGASAQLNATGGASYAWSNATSLDNANIANPIATPTATTTYTVTVTDVNGCVSTGITTVTVNPLPVVTMSPPAAICIGQSSQLNASGGVSYVWNNAASLDNTNIANPVATPTVTTTYTVTVTDANGCINTGHTTITVNPLPTVITSPDAAICIGTSTRLTASGGVIYAWNNTASLDNTNIANPTATPTVTATYTVTVTDANGCVNTGSTTITVNPLPTPTAMGGTICIGASTQLNATGGISYAWSNAASLDNANIANPTATPTVTTIYTVTATDVNGCTGTASTTVTLNPLPTVTMSPPAAICIGQSSQLNASGGVTYVWNNTASLDNANIANPVATPTVTTTYTVTVTDANGCVSTGSTTITVNPLPVVGIHPDTLLCAGQSVSLFATGGGGYMWGPSAGLNCLNCPTPLARPTVNTTYTVTVTTLHGCKDSTHVRVSLNTVDARFATSDTVACAPTTVRFQDLSVADSSIVAWSWSFGDGGVSSAQNPSHTYTTPGIYTARLQVTTHTGCTDTASLVLIINSLPAVAAGPNRTICINDTTTLQGTGGISYQWSPAGSLNNANIASPQAFPTQTTTYGLTVTDANGCQGTSQVTVTVNPLPIITITPGHGICENDSTQLIATGGVSYLWSPATGLTCTTCDTVKAAPSLTRLYTVLVTDTNGCRNTASSNVIVNTRPAIHLSNDTAICIGDTAMLWGGFGTSYQWSPATGLDCATCPNVTATPDTTTTYTFTATNSQGCSNSRQVTVTVNPLPTVVTTPDTGICHGQAVELSAMGGIHYQWTPSQGITCSNNCNAVMAAPDSNTTYRVLVTDSKGCRNTGEIDVTVYHLEAAFDLTDSSACTPRAISLTDRSHGTNPITQWLWDLEDGGIANTPNASVTYATPGQRNIILLVMDNKGCTDTAYQLIDMLATPVAAAGPDTVICYGGEAQLNATGGTIFHWTGDNTISDPTIANPTVKPGITTTYYFHTALNNGCQAQDTIVVVVNPLPVPHITGDTVACYGDSLRFTASGGVDYIWSPAQGLTTTVQPSTTAHAEQDITYTVMITDANGCRATDSIALKVNPIPAIDASPNVEICLGESVALEANGALSYGWGPNQDISCLDCTNPTASPAASITYTVVGFNEFGCANLDTVRVTVRPLPTVATIDDVTMCNGETLELTTTAIGATGFNWTVGGANVSNTQSPIVQPATSTVYVVEAINQYGCTDLDTVAVKVIETILAQVSDDAVICEGQQVDLRIDILETGLSMYQVTWLPKEEFDLPHELSQTFQPTESMTVQVAIVGGDCAADTQSINIVVNPSPTTELGPNRVVMMGEQVTLDANASANVVDYYWAPNDSLSCADCDRVSFYAFSDNSYTVRVTDENGCMAWDTVNVRVYSTCAQDIFIPNSFSPNNDKSNDVLYVRSHSVEQIKIFRVFDRWGNLVFETTDITQGWNGTYMGRMVDPGVFVYYLEGTCPNGGDVFLKGNVTVLR